MFWARPGSAGPGSQPRTGPDVQTGRVYSSWDRWGGGWVVVSAWARVRLKGALFLVRAGWRLSQWVLLHFTKKGSLWVGESHSLDSSSACPPYIAVSAQACDFSFGRLSALTSKMGIIPACGLMKFSNKNKHNRHSLSPDEVPHTSCALAHLICKPLSEVGPMMSPIL